MSALNVKFIIAENIQAATMKYLVAKQPTAIIYSGHGAQLRSTQGYFEALVCLARCGGFSYFLDREILRIADAGISFLADSCHAGGLDDGTTPASRETLQRYMPKEARSLGLRNLRDVPRDIITGVPRSTKRGVIVAATQKNQSAYEFTGPETDRPGGLFTQTIAEVLEESGRATASWAQVVVDRVISRSQGSQIPDAEQLDEFFNRIG